MLFLDCVCVCVSQVLLGEVNAGVSTTQVVVKELKSSASVQDQMQFLEETQPYRSEPLSLSLSPLGVHQHTSSHTNRTKARTDDGRTAIGSQPPFLCPQIPQVQSV